MSQPESRTSRPVVFGEVLFDAFADGAEVLGGAPFNVAWHLAAFGADPLLVSRLGEDAPGERVRAAMVERGMSLAGMQDDPARPTGRVLVELGDDGPRYEIPPAQAWDAIDAGAAEGALPADVAALYHGTLAARAPASAAALDRLAGRPELPVFVDVNLRAPWWRRQAVRAMLRRARWIKLSEDELRSLEPQPAGLGEAARALLDDSGAELLLVTRGERGAVALTAAGGRREVPAAALAAPEVDSVGAGDAFAAVSLLGLIGGWPLTSTLERAAAFAAEVCGVRGATPRDPEIYRRHRRRWRMVAAEAQ